MDDGLGDPDSSFRLPFAFPNLLCFIVLLSVENLFLLRQRPIGHLPQWAEFPHLKNLVTDLLSVRIIAGLGVPQNKCPNSLKA